MLFRVHAIVFDLGDVLVDPMPAIRSVWADWARAHGIDDGSIEVAT